VDAILDLGTDRVMFSTDWPFENIDHAANWFDSALTSEQDRPTSGRDDVLALFPPRPERGPRFWLRVVQSAQHA
jgi:2,3-dihydroxybenzoate decarboxylase